ncbi:tetratricopeptide repeat protein [Desulfolutivibrio sulfoxidireducens]|uniref:tetratricopeptide repeat protein n=1 Tax=Desulfolutivibrio sulfoxidireducens TaxID=2773299 RepID=UPI00159E9747|nr:tetratricopeptide repeat protein [Desulfolutivibrio sulfoxidireducens]QLA18314.1 tetratricopeptide repeat protein [Desulfolutivibrio sulfoxidireducens]
MTISIISETSRGAKNIQSEQDYIKKGNAFLKQGLYNESEYCFQQAIKLFPESPLAKERYAYAALRKLNLKEAHARYLNLKADHPDNPSGYIGLGNVLLRQGDIHEAEDVFKEAVDLFPENPIASERYANCALRLLKLEDAYSRYIAHLRKHPDNANGYIGFGGVLLKYSLFGEAEGVYETGRVRFPENQAILERYANVALQLGNLDDAYHRYAEFRDKYPQNPIGYIGIGNVLLKHSLFEEAEETFKASLALFPENQVILERIANVAVRLSHLEEARTRYLALQEYHPEHQSGYIGLGNVLIKMNLLDEAERIFGEALKIFPDSHKILEEFALVALRKLKFDQAHLRYEHLRDTHPNSPSGLVGLGNVFLKMNKLERSEEIFREANRIFPNNKIVLKAILFACYFSMKSNMHAMHSSFSSLAMTSYAQLKSEYPEEFSSVDYKAKYASVYAAKVLSCAEKGIMFRQEIDCQEEKLKKIAILGDSHVFYMFDNRHAFTARGFTPNVLPIPGASVAGLGKLHSTMQLYPKIQHYICISKTEYVVLKFGQVDVDFIYYYKKFVLKRHSLDFEKYAEALTDKYVEIAHNISKLAKVLTCSVNLPSLFCRKQLAIRGVSVITEGGILTHNSMLSYKKLEALLPSIQYRTKMTLSFNELLKKKCQDKQVAFLDTTSLFLDKQTGILNIANQKDNDHHYVLTEREKERVIDLTVNEILKYE